MSDVKVYNALNRPTEVEKMELVDFLFENLEQYGDAKKDIQTAMEYAMKERTSFGGFIVTCHDEINLAGVVVVNQTGMSGYIPENILVYIATRKDTRGKGIGKKLMETVISTAKGDIALHVEANNPAKKLYEKYGFKNPYLEMRLKR